MTDKRNLVVEDLVRINSIEDPRFSPDGQWIAFTADDIERDILVRALEQHRFNRTAAGASLGLSLRQMRYRMARLGVNVADHVGERGDTGF